jgi:hypothetical protein
MSQIYEKENCVSRNINYPANEVLRLTTRILDQVLTRQVLVKL